MARTHFKIKYSCSFAEAKEKVESILRRRDFHPETLSTGEHVWKQGVGFLTAMKFIKVDYAQGELHLNAWVQAGLGSVGGAEMDLTGFVGALPKKQVMSVIEEIKLAF